MNQIDFHSPDWHKSMKELNQVDKLWARTRPKQMSQLIWNTNCVLMCNSALSQLPFRFNKIADTKQPLKIESLLLSAGITVQSQHSMCMILLHWTMKTLMKWHQTHDRKLSDSCEKETEKRQLPEDDFTGDFFMVKDRINFFFTLRGKCIVLWSHKATKELKKPRMLF